MPVAPGARAQEDARDRQPQETEAGASPWPQVALRPQSALLSFFGDYVGDGGRLAASGDVVTLLGRIGVGEHAARATLTRMTHRGLLLRAVRGRRAFVGLTEQGRATTAEGRSRSLRADLTQDHWDGRWTVVAFSMPESWQRERHDVRSRLTWAGFGLVQSGLWVAPRSVDVPALLRGLDVDGHVRAFDAAPVAPTEASRLVAEAYDLEPLADRYRGFLERWSGRHRGQALDADPLAARIVVTADWIPLLREDPRLPLRFLPADWPAVEAATLHRTLSERLRPAAEAQFEREIETIPAPA